MKTITEIKTITGKKTNGLIPGFYRSVSYYITWVLLSLHFSANMTSLFGVLLGIISAVFFMTMNYFLFMIGSLFLFFSMMMDYCDGEIARYRTYKKLPDEPFRKYGGFFDSLNHLAVPLVYVALAFSFRTYGFFPIMLLGILSAFLRLIDTSLFKWINSLLKIKKKPPIVFHHKQSNNAKKIRSIGYSALLVPFFFLLSSCLDLLFDLNITFFVWIYFLCCGILLFILEYAAFEKETHYSKKVEMIE